VGCHRPLQDEECAVEFFMFDEEKSVDDQPVIVRTGDLEHEFKVEIGFLELEVVAYTGSLKIVGYAHFGHGGRHSSRRSSDHLRHISDDKLTLSRASIYRVATDELVETAPFVVINLDRVEVFYARDVPREGEGSAVQETAGA
jgi:hypothetical protein